MQDTVAMQKEAEARVRRMQERNRQLLQNGPTFGTCFLPPSPAPASPAAARSPARQLPLLLLLLALADNSEHTLPLLLAYLAL